MAPGHTPRAPPIVAVGVAVDDSATPVDVGVGVAVADSAAPVCVGVGVAVAVSAAPVGVGVGIGVCVGVGIGVGVGVGVDVGVGIGVGVGVGIPDIVVEADSPADIEDVGVTEKLGDGDAEGVAWSSRGDSNSLSGVPTTHAPTVPT